MIISSLLPSLVFFPDNDEENTDTVAAFRHWALPNAEFEGLWENLVFDSDIKEQVNFLDSSVWLRLISQPTFSDAQLRGDDVVFR